MGEFGRGVYLDFSDAIKRLGEDVIRERYGNLIDMYERITGEDPYKVPMRIYPALHYTMGGLWVDYNLMSNLPGLFVIGEANFSDHGANRLGASALMQGLADGYFVLPYTIGDYLSTSAKSRPSQDHAAFKQSVSSVADLATKLLSIKGKRTVDSFHKELGLLLWENCGMARTDASLKAALARIPKLREEYWKNVNVLGGGEGMNKSLERAGRVADYLEFAELLCQDALHRQESCGGHFRSEYQTEEGEAKRDDANFAYVAAWEYQGTGKAAALHKEPLSFENIKLAERSYK